MIPFPRNGLATLIALILALLVSVSPGQGAGESKSQTGRPAPRHEVMQLVGRGNGPYLTDEERVAWRQELATRPDIKPDLLEMLHLALIVDKNPETVEMPLVALRERKDLTPAELAEVVGPLEECRDLKVLQPEQHAFILPALLVLKNYPSTKHEDLAIAYLSHPLVIGRQGAAELLGAIGTAKSLAPMRAYVETEKPPPGLSNEDYGHALKWLAALEARVTAATTDAPDPAPATTAPPPVGSSATPPREPTPPAATPAADQPVRPGMAWLVSGGLAVIALILLVVRLQRPGRTP